MVSSSRARLQGTVKAHTYANAQEIKHDLQMWFVYYNFYRPHRPHRRIGRIGRITPYEAVCWWHQKQPELFLREPTALLAYRSQPLGT